MPLKRTSKIGIIVVAIVATIALWRVFSVDYNRSKPTEFYLIASNVDSAGGHEIFVVHNAPCDTAEIREVIERFNLETLPIDSIRKYRVRGRTFYRETEYMTRHFKEGKEYSPSYNSWDNIQDFRNHEDDILMITSYYLDGANEEKCYSYWLNWDYDFKQDDKYINEVNTFFYDLDSFYVEERAKYKMK